MTPVKEILKTNARHVDSTRLWQSLMDLARLGATAKGGVCRLALTDLDRQARDLFVQWCEAAGCSVSIDAVGNIFARRPGRNPKLPPVMTGSHIDTQPTGGKFDGCFGVMAGLEVIRTLNDLGVETEASLEVVVWTNEEGSRFAPCMMGSGVFMRQVHPGRHPGQARCPGCQRWRSVELHWLRRSACCVGAPGGGVFRSAYRAGADP